MLLSQPKTTPSSPPHDSRSPHGSPRHRRPPTAIRRPPVSPTARIMLAVAAWLRARHRSRCLLLVLCSPLLVPLLCATFPLLCAAELCLRVCCRKRRSGDEGGGGGEEGEREEEEEEEAERLRRCEEGRCCGSGGGVESEVGVLLQRYLEDQLRLVGSVYECGDNGDADADADDGDVGFLESCRSPLLA